MTLLTNIEKKSTLAKLLATENIQVEQNNVQTASFDVANRILTIPIFKHENKDVIDMLIAHECSHALWTGLDDWKSITEESDEYKAYCNVLEDCRIDRMIQKKYPGIVKNYINGYKELIRIDFFGVNGKDLNTLNLIDRINLYYKSSKTADISFADAEWVLDEIDNLKTLDDVKVLARKLLEQEKAKQESTSDDHSQDNIDSDDDTQDNSNNTNESESSYDDYDVKDTDDSDDNSDDNADIQQSEENTESDDNGEEQSAVGEEGGKVTNKVMPQTVQNAEDNTDKITYNGRQFLKYFSLPDTNLNTAIISNSQFRKDHFEHIRKEINSKYNTISYQNYYDWLKKDFKKFKNDNLKTVNYLVKEFEMKKSATAYKKASTDKTGVIDSLKLKNYKFSDDIFKRLTIMPDEKNHGFIFLVDWSGSMVNCMDSTIDQLVNLIYFAKKINIPFEVYAFTEFGGSRYDTHQIESPFTYKSGNLEMGSNLRLINIASHKLKSRELDDSMIALWLNRNYYKFYERGRYYYNDKLEYDGQMIGVPNAYLLSSTPLNEALVALDKIIPLFKNKYSIEKLSLITLTDGHANRVSNTIVDRPNIHQQGYKHGDILVPVIKDKNKTYTYKKEVTHNYGYYYRNYESRDYTALLIKMLKSKYNLTAVGFHIVKNVRDGIGLYSSDNKLDDNKKSLSKGHFVADKTHGYDEFYILNNKKLSIQSNNKIDDIQEDMKPGQIKRLFAGGLKSKLQSRIVLNKFIERVA